MKYQQIKDRSESDFKRLTGVRVDVFRQMLQTLFSPTNRGRPAKLSCSDQLLMTLMYWREYRTQYHIAQAYAVSESTVCRTIQRVENRLIQCRQFRLPSKRELLESQTNIQGVIVDVTEQPIERPKKTASILQWQEKKTYTASPTNHQSTQLTNHCHRFQ